MEAPLPLPKSKKEIKVLAGELVPSDRAGDYAQALMDLGATICTPISPKCLECVWSEWCSAYVADVATDYPRKIKKKATPKRYGVIFVVRSKGELLMRRRADKGMLGGTVEFPASPWDDKSATDYPVNPLDYAPLEADWTAKGIISHVFTHYEVNLRVYTADVTRLPLKNNADWLNVSEQSLINNDKAEQKLTTLMMKVWKRSR